MEAVDMSAMWHSVSEAAVWFTQVIEKMVSRPAIFIIVPQSAQEE